jgi:carboxymethylenebutenolidase
MRDMAKRLAAEGYSVLVPNPYYRVQKAPFVESAENFNFNDPAQRGKLTPLMGSIGAAGAAEKDAAAFVAWLDRQSAVDRTKKIGTQGYCMGGPMAFRTAAANPDRVGGVASFHGGGLVTMGEDSPHMQVAKTKAALLVAIASNDDKQRPDEKNVLKETFAKSGNPAEIEVYSGAHGWCPPDSQVYKKL